MMLFVIFFVGKPQVRRSSLQLRAGHTAQAEVPAAAGRAARAAQLSVRV